MKIKIFLSSLGSFLKLLGALMLIPGIVAAIYGESSGVISFALASLLSLSIGILLRRVGARGMVGNKEAFAIVSIGWLAAAFFGALPYAFLGLSLVDSLFESMAAFTTTGSTILTDSNAQGYWIINPILADQSLVWRIQRALFPNLPGFASSSTTYFGLLFWRSFAQWLGGMGIILLFIVVLPHLGVAGRPLYRAEGSGAYKGCVHSKSKRQR
jgi:trk system potassium uptake protein TrkH